MLDEGEIDEQIDALVFSFLVTIDAHGALVPDAAREVPTRRNGGVSRDGLRIVYHLRRGIRWQDGAPLTARDCAFTYRAIVNPRNDLPSRAGYEYIRSVTAPDDTTVVVTLARPYAPIVDAFLAPDYNYPIMPEHLLAKYADVNAIPYDGKPIGSGPFRVASWRRGDSLTLVRNDGYFRGPAKLARIVVTFVPDPATVVNELRTGEIDAAFALPPVYVRQVRALPHVAVRTTPFAAAIMLYFNTVAGPTADAAVRRALVAAIDLPKLVHDGTDGVDDAHDPMRGLFAWGYRHVPDPVFDLDASERALDGAGWRRGTDGIRVKNGERLSLTLVASTTTSNVLTTGIQQAMRRIGADLAIKAFNPTEFQAPASSGGPMFGQRFSLALFNLYANGGDPDVLPYFGCAERVPHGFNFSGYCEPAFEAAAQDGARSYDGERRIRDGVTIERAIHDEAPFLALSQIRELDAYTTRFGGFEPAAYTPYWNVRGWSLSAR